VTECHTVPTGSYLAVKHAVQAIKSLPGRAEKFLLFVLPKPPEPCILGTHLKNDCYNFSLAPKCCISQSSLAC